MFDEDFNLFFDVEDFAIGAVLDGVPVCGILGTDYIEANFIESNDPVFRYRTSDAPDVSHASVLITPAQKYSVTGVFPDGTGVTTLELRKR